MTVRPATHLGPDTDAHSAQLDATCALAALTVVSALAFARVFTTVGWVVPVIACALAGHLVAWALRRVRLPTAPAVAAAIIAVGVLSLYLVLPGALTWGLPFGHMFHTLGHSLNQAGSGMRGAVTPVASTPGYSLLVAWGAGIAAISADLLAFRLRSPLQAMAPPVALFVTGGAIGTSRGRGWTVGTEVAALLAFLLVEQLSSERHYATWLGERSGHTTKALVTAGSITAVVAVLAAVALTPAIPSREGDGLLGWRSAPGSSGGDRVTPSPFDDLRTRLVDNPDTLVMTVASSQPSYWRLTSLDSFDGTVWSADDSYQSVEHHLPGISPTATSRQVVEHFNIAALDSIWLPTGFNPEAVARADQVSWDPDSGSLISAQPTSDGQTYDVFASQQLATLSPAVLAGVPSVGATSPPQDLALPSNIPVRVRQLAQQITAGAHTEYAKAYALEQYFHQPIFHYTTSPASDDSVNALSDFLFTTRAGYCQQFAGAYAVLAREVGVPTRIAIGFQAGTAVGEDYIVTDADAHAWPEVWFPTVGWVPFEPTPGRTVPSATYTGNTGTIAGPVPPSAPTTLANASGDSSRIVKSRDTVVPTSVAGSTTSNGSAGGATLDELGVALGVVAAAAALWTGLLMAIRRLRWRRRRIRARRRLRAPLRPFSPTRQPDRGDPSADPAVTGRVLVSWAEVAELLAWWRMRRRPDETVSEFAERAAAALRASHVEPSVSRDLRALAALVQLAEFSAVGLSADTGADAEHLAEAIIADLRRGAPRGRRIEHLVHPRHAIGTSTVETMPRAPAGRSR
jgi:transglutaminase-like putative cysteine protease